MKHIFRTRSINIEEMQVKLIKEKENNKYTIQIFDGKNTEEKIPLEDVENLNKKQLAIRFNKKVKVFC